MLNISEPSGMLYVCICIPYMQVTVWGGKDNVYINPVYIVCNIYI